MKRRFLSARKIGYSAIATLLALCSIPDVTSSTSAAHHHHFAASKRHHAVPTVSAAPLNPSASSQVNPAPNQGTPAEPGSGTPNNRQPGTSESPNAPKPVTPVPDAPPKPTAPLPGTLSPDGYTAPTNPRPLYRLGKMRVRVIDGRTMQPLPGAEVVLIETEQRLTTGKDGYTDWFQAPIIRNPRYRPMIAELHGQLGVIAYKNGYRDSVHLGIRMHDGALSQATVWMYKIGPGDRRIEPVFYEEPYHHLWLIELTDRFRSKTQPGEGPQRP